MVKGHKFPGSSLFVVNLDRHKLMDNLTKFGGMFKDEIEILPDFCFQFRNIYGTQVWS